MHDNGLNFSSFVDFALRRVREQVPAVDQDAMRVILTLHRVTSLVVYDLEASVHRSRGWSWPGFRLLFVLWLAGPMAAKRAAELSGMSRAAVSALANTLVRDGLVYRASAEHDRRTVLLGLTEQGAAAIEEAFLAHNERERLWVEALTPDERHVLVTLLTKLLDRANDAAIRRRE